MQSRPRATSRTLRRTAAPGLAALVALALLAPAPRADVLVLEDGRILDDVKLEVTPTSVLIHYENGDIEVPDVMVLDVLVEGGTSWEPRTEEEQEKYAKGLVPFDGEWVSQRRRDELIAKRLEDKRQAIEDLKAHRLWRNRHKEETKHFLFEYTVPVNLFVPFRDRMEAYFNAFAKDWKVKQPRELGQLLVCFYNDREYFHQVSGAPFGVIGYFRFVEPLELDFYFDRLDRELTEDVMYHETNHYLQKLIDPDFSYPHFPGESLAEFYGASQYDPKARKFTTGLIQEGRLAEVQRDIVSGERMGLLEMVGSDRMYEHYTWGWTLVHFLMNHPRHAKRFQAFVLDLAQAKDVSRELMGMGTLRTVRGSEVLRVFRDRLGLRSDDDVKALEQEWHAYVDERLSLVSYRGLEKAAVSAQSSNMPLKAKRLFQEAIDAGSQTPMTFHKYAEMLARDGEHAKAIDLWREAIRLDPLEAEFYLSMGRALVRKGDKDEGRRLMRLALEIDEEIASWGDEKLLEELGGAKDGDGG